MHIHIYVQRGDNTTQRMYLLGWLNNTKYGHIEARTTNRNKH